MDDFAGAQDALRRGAAALGVPLDERQLWLFERYAALLAEWNERINLTRVPTADWVPLHFLDSLTILPAVALAPAARLLDVGTGAGLPGMAIAIARPDVEVFLLDATRKKLDFLRAVIDDIGLARVHTVHGRAEDLCRQPAWRAAFDVVAARAVAKLDVLAGWLLPFVKPAGTAVAMKSAAIEEEIAAARDAIAAAGGRIREVRAAAIPGCDAARRLVILERTRDDAARAQRGRRARGRRRGPQNRKE